MFAGVCSFLLSTGTTHIDVAESCVKMMYKLLCYQGRMTTAEPTLNDNGRNPSEDLVNEIRLLGGVELLQNIVVHKDMTIRLRTMTQKCLNILMTPRVHLPRLPRNYAPPETITTAPIVEFMQKLDNTNVVEQWKQEQQLKLNKLHQLNIQKDTMELFKDLPAWNSGGGDAHGDGDQHKEKIMVQKEKDVATNWLDVAYKNKTLLLNHQTQDVLDLFDTDDTDSGEEEEKEEEETRDGTTQPSNTKAILGLVDDGTKNPATAMAPTLKPTEQQLKYIFALLDIDVSGDISYMEVMKGLRNPNVIEFIQHKCSVHSQLKLLLQPKLMKSTMHSIVDSTSTHRFNYSSFASLATTATSYVVAGLAAAATGDVQGELGATNKTVPGVGTIADDMKSVGLLFDLLDLNGDGLLTYSEILHKLESPTTIVMNLIETNAALLFLLAPTKLRRTLKKIRTLHVGSGGGGSGSGITKDSLKLYVASSRAKEKI